MGTTQIEPHAAIFRKECRIAPCKNAERNLRSAFVF